MVLPGERDYMVTGPERSKTLHNFSLPCLKWGSQRNLRCMKVESGGGSGSYGGAGAGAGARVRRRSSPLKLENSWEAISAGFADADQRRENRRKRLRTTPTRSSENGEEGIDEFREKIMSDLRTIADRMKESIFEKEALGDKDEEEHTGGGDQEKDRRRANQKENEKEKDSETEVPPPAEAIPWNLRTRRAASKAASAGAGNYNGNETNGGRNHNNEGLRIEERRADSSPSRSDLAMALRMRERGAAGGEKKERRKFSISLTGKEIEKDFVKLLGRRPSRRPKKRPRAIQKQLSLLFPGLYLNKVTHDLYKVPESAETEKR